MMEEMRGVKARVGGSGQVRWQRSWVEWGEWTSGCLLTFVFLVIMVGDVSAAEPRLEGEGVLGEHRRRGVACPADGIVELPDRARAADAACVAGLTPRPPYAPGAQRLTA